MAEDLEAAWKNADVTMRCRQQLAALWLMRSPLISTTGTRDVLITHWKGEQHSSGDDGGRRWAEIASLVDTWKVSGALRP